MDGHVYKMFLTAYASIYLDHLHKRNMKLIYGVCRMGVVT